MKKKIMFWARECPHCRNMMPLVDRLVEEEGIEIEKLEIWYNEENADLMRSYKDVIAPLPRDKPIAFGSVEPLNSSSYSFRHFSPFLF